MFFIKPGTQIIEPNSTEIIVIPYKGIVLSNQKYLEIVSR